MQEGFGYVKQLKPEQILKDRLRGHGRGQARGARGHGRLLLGRARSRTSRPASCRSACAVAYYGGGIVQDLDKKPKCAGDVPLRRAGQAHHAGRRGEDQSRASGRHLPSLSRPITASTATSAAATTRRAPRSRASARSSSSPSTWPATRSLNEEYSLEHQAQRFEAAAAAVLTSTASGVDADSGATLDVTQSRHRREARHRAEDGRGRDPPRHRSRRGRPARVGERRRRRSAPTSCAAGST